VGQLRLKTNARSLVSWIPRFCFQAPEAPPIMRLGCSDSAGHYGRKWCGYLTVNVALPVSVSGLEVPLKVTVYVPGFVLVGKKIPDTARAWPWRRIVSGRSPQ